MDVLKDFLATAGVFNTIALACICVSSQLDYRPDIPEKQTVTVQLKFPNGETKTLECPSKPADGIISINIATIDKKHYDVSSDSTATIDKENQK